MNFAKTAIAAFIALAAVPLCAAGLVIDLSSAEPYEAEGNVVKYSLPVGEGVDFRPDIAVGDLIELRVPGGIGFALEVVSAPPPGIAGQSFIARDAGGASAVVKVAPSGIRIMVDDFANMMMYTFRCRGDDIELTVRDTSDEVDGECATCVAEGVQAAIPETIETNATVPAPTLVANDAGAFPLAEQKSVVDILVAFDQGAKEWLEKGNSANADTVEDFADYAIDKMNMVLATSQLDHLFFYRLAGVTTIDAICPEINNALLTSLRFAEGPFAKIPGLKDKYGADTVTLLVNKTSGSTSGLGYPLQGTNDTYFASFYEAGKGCNICDIYNVDYRHTMSHETGHNMGCGHSNQQGPKNSGPEDGPFPYSCGYHFTAPKDGKRYHTVMAYYRTENANGVNYSDYQHIPYFSSPDMGEDEFGCAVGTEELNNNHRVLTYTYNGVSQWHDRVKPYDWDVRFVDDNGNDIPDGSYFPGYYYVTMTNQNPNAVIYYTYDGSMPTGESAYCKSGTRFTMNNTKTITACAVVDGVAQSVRTIRFISGCNWSGDANGNGLWIKNDSTVRTWDGEYFYNGDYIKFPDLTGISSVTVTVKGDVSPGSASFTACETSYTFDKGDDSAQINLPDVNFSPVGDLVFNVPVKLEATTFTNRMGRALTFNAPFGQTVDATSGYCTNMIGIGPYGTMTVAPGLGKTQEFDKLNNVGWYAGNSTFRVGEGTVIFKGVINGGAGVIGRTKLEVGNGGNLVFNMGGGTGHEMDNTSLTVEKGGAVTFNNMEHLRRTLFLNGGTIRSKRLDLMRNPGVYVTDDSSIEDNGSGYILIRYSDSEINVSDGKTLTLGIGTQTDNRGDTSGWGIIKRGGGTIVANGELKHSGVTDIETGTLAVGYSSGSTRYGQGWIVADGAKLMVNSGKTLNVPSLALDGGATVSVPAASSAPLTATDEVSVANVYLEITGAANLAAGASYPLLSSSGGITGIRDANASRLPALAPGLKWRFELSAGTLSAIVEAVPETPATVDVLVAYDNGAQSYVADKGLSLEVFAQAQIAKMNEVLVTNRLDSWYTYRLAGVCKVDGTYNNIDTAPALIAAGEDAAVSLRAKRELYGADTVTLLVDTTGNTLGNSSPLNFPYNVASQHECAFSVCSIRAVDTGKQHTMIHENAHNMGCGHSRAQSQINSPFEYGRGFYFKDGDITRHTIMAYGGDNDASWYFSTSSTQFGFTLGDETNDNARVLRETCGAVAKWREGLAEVLEGAEVDGAILETCARYPWYVDGDGFIRSFNQKEDYGNQCTTPLRMTVVGPKRLTFSHKSYFGGESIASENYSHFDVLLDDSPVLSQRECTNSWSEAYVNIPEGTHEVTFVFSQRFAMNNPSDYKGGTPEADDAVWLKDIVLGSTTLDIPMGVTVRLSDVPDYITAITGEGTLACGASLPSSGLSLTNSLWKGTVAFNGLSGDECKNFRFELYGNANSRIQLTNCSIPYLNNNNATFAGTLILMDDEGHNAAFSTVDGYSGNYNVFGALEGEGSMYFSGKPKQGYVFNVATNYNGSIEVNADYYGDNLQGRRIVFGNVSSAADLPEQSATITLKSGASASIGPNATWSAHHGVEIAGTLIVKGPGSTLDCNDSGTLTLKFDDGATFRFDADGAKLTLANALKFDSGTVKIAFGNDFELLHGTKLIGWSTKDDEPKGSFKFADSSLESTWQLVKSTEGLSVEMLPDGDGFFDGEAQVGFVKKASLDDWLEGQNFWMYEDYMTWQDFLAEVGSNGYLNWQSFLLGFETENDFRTFDAVIEIVDGAITVRTTEGGVPEGYSSHVEKRIYFKDALDKPWGEGTVMDGKAVDLGAPGNGGFYKVEVMFR